MKFFFTFFSLLVSLNSFAGANPANFSQINKMFDSSIFTQQNQILGNAFKGTCYFAIPQVIPFEGYIGGVTLGTNVDQGIFDSRIGNMYVTVGNEKVTKATVMQYLYEDWSDLSLIQTQAKLIVSNKGEPHSYEIRQTKDGKYFVAEFTLKMDLPCKDVMSALQPLCVGGVIPKGTQYQSCFYSEKLQ